MEKPDNLIDAPLRLLFVNFLDFQAVGDVVLHFHVGPEGKVLEHHVDATLVRRNRVMRPGHLPSAYFYRAAVQRQNPGDNPKERGFPAAGGAEDTYDFAFLDA